MRLADVGRIRNCLRRSEAWRRHALDLELELDAANSAAEEAEAVVLGPCPRCADMRREISEEVREGQRAARDAYGEGYQRAREDSEGSP